MTHDSNLPARVSEVLADVHIEDMILENWIKDIQIVDGQLQLRWLVTSRCIHSGKRVRLESDWRPVQYTSRSRIVRTAKSIAVNVVLHELMEHFRYRDRRIFNPHADPDLLVDACDDERAEALLRAKSGP